jgi:hypothetical protein
MFFTPSPLSLPSLKGCILKYPGFRKTSYEEKQKSGFFTKYYFAALLLESVYGYPTTLYVK